VNAQRWQWWSLLAVVTLALAALTAAGCGSDDDDSSGGSSDDNAPTKLGKGEGEVDLIAWAGYVEDGSTDPAVDWEIGRASCRERV